VKGFELKRKLGSSTRKWKYNDDDDDDDEHCTLQ